ncbi:hypothetical protein RhiirB3_426586 [Rhizophagus irregularis]|nr:hypothetical protein RhiirB3_426586 [Rhizophagus irregularis]
MEWKKIKAQARQEAKVKSSGLDPALTGEEKFKASWQLTQNNYLRAGEKIIKTGEKRPFLESPTKKEVEIKKEKKEEKEDKKKMKK